MMLRAVEISLGTGVVHNIALQMSVLYQRVLGTGRAGLKLSQPKKQHGFHISNHNMCTL